MQKVEASLFVVAGDEESNEFALSGYTAGHPERLFRLENHRNAFFSAVDEVCLSLQQRL